MDRAEDNNAADRARRKVMPGSAPPRDLTVADRLSADGAAVAAGVSVDTIRRAYRSGALRAFRPGGARRIVILRLGVSTSSSMDGCPNGGQAERLGDDDQAGC
jgi:hypothetical protein